MCFACGLGGPLLGFAGGYLVGRETVPEWNTKILADTARIAVQALTQRRGSAHIAVRNILPMGPPTVTEEQSRFLKNAMPEARSPQKNSRR
jgi:hypothetical protein